MLDQSLGFFDHHLGDLHVTRGRFIERGTDYFAPHRTLHVGDFFGTLVDQQNDQRNFGVIGGDRIRDVLQQHRFAGAGRRDDQAALAFSDRRDEIHHAAREIVPRCFQFEAPVRIERGQVIEENLVARFLRRFKVDGVDFNQRKVALAFFRRPNLARDSISRPQIEAADLRRRDIHVVGARQVVVFRGTQETESIGQAFEDALRKDQAAFLRLRLQNFENELLFPQAGGVQHAHFLRHLVQVLDAHVLQLDQIESRGCTWFTLLLLATLLTGMPLGTLMWPLMLLRRSALLPLLGIGRLFDGRRRFSCARGSFARQGCRGSVSPRVPGAGGSYRDQRRKRCRRVRPLWHRSSPSAGGADVPTAAAARGAPETSASGPGLQPYRVFYRKKRPGRAAQPSSPDAWKLLRPGLSNACTRCVFVIACHDFLALTRPVTAENGSGSACCLMAFSPRCCSA